LFSGDLSAAYHRKSLPASKKNALPASQKSNMIGLYVRINQQILTYLFPGNPGTGIGTLNISGCQGIAGPVPPPFVISGMQ
jgi:hypothetical protein